MKKAENQNIIESFKKPESLDQMLDYRLYLVYRDCGVVTEKICNDIFGITRRRLRIIFLLMEYPNISVSELAALAELDLTQTSRTISSMMREGYLKRLSNPDNARYSILKLTDKSIDIYKDLLQQYQYVNNQLIDNFSDSELQQLDHLLKKLRNNAQQVIEKYKDQSN